MGSTEMMMSPIEIILAAAVVLLFIVWLIWQVLRSIRDKAAVSVKAVLIAKYEEDDMGGTVYVGSHTSHSEEEKGEKHRRYLIDFRDDDQNDRSFEVEKDIYMLLQDGEKGVLTYRGDRFLSFRSDDTAAHN